MNDDKSGQGRSEGVNITGGNITVGGDIAEFYLNGFLFGGSYKGIPLEINAYGLEGVFRNSPHRRFSVEGRSFGLETRREILGPIHLSYVPSLSSGFAVLPPHARIFGSHCLRNRLTPLHSSLPSHKYVPRVTATIPRGTMRHPVCLRF